jgi:hypothetical protein
MIGQRFLGCEQFRSVAGGHVLEQTPYPVFGRQRSVSIDPVQRGAELMGERFQEPAGKGGLRIQKRIDRRGVDADQ